MKVYIHVNNVMKDLDYNNKIIIIFVYLYNNLIV